jgi:hypothetical protein
VRRLTTLALAVVAAASAAAAAVAQYAVPPVITPSFAVTPRDAGTKQKPRNALVYTRGLINAESNSTLRRLEYFIPRTVVLDGTGFPTCSSGFINANGDDRCPSRSRVGTGAATALLGPDRSRLDFDVDVYVAGPKALTIYLQTSLFNIALDGTIRGRVVGFDLPERVQQPLPGLYSYVTSIESSIGRQKGIRATTRHRGRTRFYASAIGCANGRHAGKVRGYLAANPDPPVVAFAEVRASSSCKK